MSILVTGGAGFIGSHLIERLLVEREEPIVCLDSFNDYYDPKLKRANVEEFAESRRVQVVEDSFCERAAMDRLFEEHSFDYVIHLGAYGGVRYSVENPFPYQHNNVLGTLTLLESVRQHGIRRFLFASSSTVYGSGASVPFAEDQELGTPLSPYGVTKRAGELLCLNYQHLFDIPIVALRFFSVYGPRLRPDLALSIFTKAVLEGRPLPLFGDGSIRRDFTHVSDVCGGILAALEAPTAVGECLNLGHNEPIAVRDLIAMIEEAAGEPAVIEQRPERSEDMPVTSADLTKSRRVLNYQPVVSFSEGVPEFVDWYRDWYRGKKAG